MNSATDMRRLRAALAAAPSAVTVDVLRRSEAWRPEDWDALVVAALQAGEVREDGAGPEPRLRWADPARRTEELAAARPEDLAALLSHAPFPALLLEGARAAARDRDHHRARLLYDALAAAPDRALFPGGEETWVAAMVEAAQLFRALWAVPTDTLADAVAVAHAHQDRASEVVLLCALGFHWAWQDPPRSQEFHRLAVETAEAHGDPALCAEARTHLALSLLMGGRLRDGIEAMERTLGDLPEDLLECPSAALYDAEGPTPAWPVAVLALAYATTGEYPRAFDILYRMCSLGAELPSRALEHQAQLFLGLVHTLAGRPEAARPHAEAAHAYWSEPREAAYTWLAAVSLAIVRGAEGRHQEAWQLLADALPAWRIAQRLSYSSFSFALLEELERAGLPRLEGLELDAEIGRHLEATDPLLAGIAHRFRARRLISGGSSTSHAAAWEHLARSSRLLRESGGLPELHLALADAAVLADAMGRPADAERARREAAEVAARMPATPTAGSSGALRLASALLDLGRMTTIAPQREGLWGEVAARVCRDFGAERCALAEIRAEGPVLLAARGAPGWREALLTRLRQAPPPTAPSFEPALPDGSEAIDAGQLVVVPFTDQALGRRGFVALENRHTTPVVGPGDEALVDGLARQVGILLANVGLWRELLEARQRLEQENRYYREQTSDGPFVAGAAGGSPAMRRVHELVARVAPTSTPVLVTGETGVGKELVAREIHDLSRRTGPFIAVHIAALAPGLAASALFGHERGAFTGATERTKGRFELADGGTLFLDEVGELSLEDQVRLLRVLEQGTFERVGGTKVIRSDFRLIAVTNRDLTAEVGAGRFREDLYFRLAAFPIEIPPLRKRREEIPGLARHFMERANRNLGVRFERIDDSDLASLVDHAWPGNVRELEHVIERAALLSEPPRLRIPPLDRGFAEPNPRHGVSAGPGNARWATLEEVERQHIRRVLQGVGGRINGKGGAAEILGLRPSTLQYWIDKLELRAELARARGTGRTVKNELKTSRG